MIFNSLTFIVFFLLVFGLYWFFFSKNSHLQNAFLIVASYVFYGWMDWRFLLLLSFTIVSSFLIGNGIYKLKQQGETLENEIKSACLRKAKLLSALNIVLNVGILFFFKYCNFFIESFVDAFSIFGIDLQIAPLRLILPIGISFYTFQALTYTIDIYRGKITPTKDALAFVAFVSFFPQLLSGPIGRAQSLIPQFEKKRVFNYNDAVDSVRQMLWGFFKKVAVADTCAIYVNKVFGDYQNQPSLALIIAAIMFTIQIYADFSGYSDVAIGVGRLFGIRLMRNFNVPYFSRNVAEFWRRWHISLTSWFTDYIYIPLGGNRVSKSKVVRNTIIVFLVSGLWHGANWTFVVWGALHALLFIPGIVFYKRIKYKEVIGLNGIKTVTVREWGGVLLTFILVTIGWIIFNSKTIADAYGYISGIFTHSFTEHFRFTIEYMFYVALVIIMFIVEWINRRRDHGLEISYVKRPIIRYIIYYILFIVIWCLWGGEQNFIYFQF